MRVTDSFTRATVWLTAATLLCLSGCGPAGPTRLKMKFDVSRKANADNPIQVDVVVAYDPELIEELARMTANEWFAQREARLRSNPGEAKFNAWKWEITPGLELAAVDESLKGEPAQGLIFANYLSRGKHSARFDPGFAQTINFGYDAFRLQRGAVVDPGKRGWRPPVGWTGVGLGAVGLGLGAWFAVLANDSASDTRNLKPRDAARHAQLVDDNDTYSTATAISMSIGAALLITGGLILLWPESDESPFRDVQTDGDREASAGGAPW
ncbi:MAG: type VI secretion system protein [Bradymonadia bacterium]|jgi:type VI secretion system protein